MLNIAWLLLFSCTSSPPVAETHQTVLRDWAWPTANGTFVRHASGALVTPTEIIPYNDAIACNDDWFLSDVPNGIISFPSATPLVFPSAPAVQAATVERVAWRLSEVLPPVTGLTVGGVTDVAPAQDNGLLVRSVRKYRRSGPPILASVGIRDNTVVATLTDRAASTTLASFSATIPTLSAPTPLPIADLNNDSRLEWILYDNGSQPFRVWLDTALNPQPVLVSGAVSTPPSITCPRP